jgi:UDP-N-acetylglucosamine 1-carboxyvinyltransferase
MSRLVIRGGRPLRGEMRVSGNKNAVLPMIAASLLTREEVVLDNAPEIRDVDAMLAIAAHLGVRVAREGPSLRLQADRVDQDEVPWELCERVRTSFLFAAPLLHRLGRARVHPPGGDLIGRRRLDAHLYGLRKLGCEVDPEELEMSAVGGMSGDTLFFDEASVTATEHILMAAVLAKGRTEIRNAASEPHVQSLAELLIGMGAQIEGVGTNVLVIHGVPELHGARIRIEGDHIEAGSYLALAAATGGELTVSGTRRSHYWMIHRVFERLGVELEIGAEQIRLPGGQRARVRPDLGNRMPRIDDGPWPQFPSDLMSAMVVLATQTEGSVLFFEKQFESRLYFVDPINQMGANIVVCDPHRVIVTGPSALAGQTMRSPDIRAGMALVIAALCATGRPSIIQNAEIVDRGYQDVVGKLRGLGADIERVGD